MTTQGTGNDDTTPVDGTRAERAEVGGEQAVVDLMYAEVDRRSSATEAELDAALRTRAEGSREALDRENRVASLTARRRRLELAEHALCFGRLDGTDGTTLRVGRLGLRRDEDPEDAPLLVDWRADAARPFYAATASRPLGIRRRRHLRLDGRRVTGVSDDVLAGEPQHGDLVGDSILVEALAATRTGRMREVIATLQHEQDAIIRSSHRGVTVVDGGPGTGKTVVALHRAAYVLYAFSRAAEDGVLVVGPNARFLDYISDVLPSLGENDVVLATTSTLAPEPVTRTDTPEVARTLGRAVLADAVARLVASYQAPAGVDFSVVVGDERITLPRAVVERARTVAVRRGRPHNVAREDLLGMLVDALVEEIEDRAARVEQQIEDDTRAMTGLDLDAATASDLRSLGLTDERVATDLGDLGADELRAQLEDDAHIDAAVERVWPRLDALVEAERLLTDPTTLATTAPTLTAAEVAAVTGRGAGWSAADLAVLDEVRAAVDGDIGRTYGHVVVDEAQELTDLAWRMVVRRCPSRSMTVVGDFAQSGPVPTARSWADAVGPHVGERLERATLSVNYRTTAEVLDATRDLLRRIAPDQSLSTSVRHGDDPVRTATPDVVAGVVDAVATLADAHPGATIGVVAPSQRVAGLRDALATGAPADAVVTVLEPDTVRGLEFDSCVVVAPDEIESSRESGPRDLYVALTRPTQRLVVVSSGPGGAPG